MPKVWKDSFSSYQCKPLTPLLFCKWFLSLTFVWFFVSSFWYAPPLFGHSQSEILFLSFRGKTFIVITNMDIQLMFQKVFENIYYYYENWYHLYNLWKLFLMRHMATSDFITYWIIDRCPIRNSNQEMWYASLYSPPSHIPILTSRWQ